MSTQLFGLIACGGSSRRMGLDKCMLTYFDKQQAYHLYEMLQPLCEKVFISCNEFQPDKIDTSYEMLIDMSIYKNAGPMAAVLTAFDQFKGKDFLLVGCDYPFLTQTDIRNFLASFSRKEMAAAFYNDEAGIYEPLLAYYNHQSSEMIFNMHKAEDHSLQTFLKNINAFKFYPRHLKAIESVDTKAGYIEALATINKTKK